MTSSAESPNDPVIAVAINEAELTGGIPDNVALLGTADDAKAILAVNPAARIRAFRDAGGPPLPTGAIDAPLDETWCGSATLVIGRLPKALAELDEIAQLIAAHASPDVRVILAARDHQLTHSMNDTLATHFAQVRGSRGMRKSRALVATDPRPGSGERYPRAANVQLPDGTGLEVRAHGGAFAGASLDLGTRVLLEALTKEQFDEPKHADSAERLPATDAGATSPNAAPAPNRGPATIPSPTPGPIGDPAQDQNPASPPRALDLGCGTGILATAFKLQHPHWQVHATDRSWAAIASTEATANANGVELHTTRADAAGGLEPASFDLILCNPPFHDGRRVDPAMANALFDAAARLLKPGGVCLTVFNASLHHRAQLQRRIGPTAQIHRDAKFIVTRSVRGPH